MSDAERYAMDDGEPEETFEDAEMEEEPDYGDGEPESGSPEASSDAFPSDEEDELVDEMEDAAPIETNRRTRRPALRVKLSRKGASDTTPNTTPSRRTSGRKTQRTARARGEDGEEDESDEIDEESDLDESAGDAPMTARQMARANRERGITNEDLVELPMDGTKRQKLTDTELALRRSETARRRRNQSEKKLEDDKIEVRFPAHPQTINRLLKKQAGKVRGKDKGEDAAEPANTPGERRESGPKPMFRYISRAEGAMLAVPLPQEGEQGRGRYDEALRTAFGQTHEAWAAAR